MQQPQFFIKNKSYQYWNAVRGTAIIFSKRGMGGLEGRGTNEAL